MNPEILQRDLIQARLLSAVFNRAVKNEVVLKGGMALRALFGSQRMTKDIDFAHDRTRSLGSLQRLMRAAIADATQGFLQNVVVTEPKQTDTVARWKIHGTTVSGTQVALTVEVSRRGYPADHISHRSYAPTETRMPAVTIDVYDAEALAASKVFALASETRVAARDLYDLDLLISMEVQPPRSLFASITDRAAFLDGIRAKIEIMTWEQFENDVLPYMADNLRSRFDRDRFIEMQLVVWMAIESWLAPSADAAADVHHQP